jgi:hypothetical protein
MQRPLILALAAGVVGGALFGGNPAGATAFCNIPSMPDGFLALRDQPSAKGKLVARMKEGDEVMLNITVADRNGWTRVYWWRGGRFNDDGSFKGIGKATGQGWVNGKLLGEECG